MSKFNRFFIPLVMFVFLTNCGEGSFDYDVNESQRGPSFTETALNVIVPVEDLVLDIPITVASLSSSDRVYDIEVVTSTGSSSEYSLVSAIIPANEIEGVVKVSFDFSEITDADTRQLVLKLPNVGGAPSNEVAIDYFREIVCNDLEITIISDVWATETYFSLKDADGAFIVERFFPFAGNSTDPQTYSQMFTLPDGTYSLEIGDLWGDGMVGTGGGVTLVGSYLLNCENIVHASGDGEFANPVSDTGIAGNDPIVEVTEFTVNP